MLKYKTQKKKQCTDEALLLGWTRGHFKLTENFFFFFQKELIQKRGHGCLTFDTTSHPNNVSPCCYTF